MIHSESQARVAYNMEPCLKRKKYKREETGREGESAGGMGTPGLGQWPWKLIVDICLWSSGSGN